jgi:trehalose 6-phosphate synthase
MVTSLHDGMNLVAKEFVATRDDAQGVLILSTFAGASHELTDALLVNPYDRSAVALALRQALAMPLAERRTRHDAMLKVMRTNSITQWYSSFIARLEGD